MAPSGAYQVFPEKNTAPQEAVPVGTIDIFNFGNKGGTTFETFLQGKDALSEAKSVAACLGDDRLRIIDERDGVDLGNAFVRLATWLVVKQQDLGIFPLRGGRKLRQILEAMLPDHGEFREVEFSEAASVNNDGFYAELPQQAIATANVGRSGFQLSVADIGEGGQGTAKMVKILRSIHRNKYSQQHWTVVLHVFHPPISDNRFKRSEVVDGKFAAAVNEYPVDARILDDWDPGTGLAKGPRESRTLRLGGASFLIPEMLNVSQAAVVGLRTRRGLELTRSSRGTEAVEKVLSRITSDALAASPWHQRAQARDRWN